MEIMELFFSWQAIDRKNLTEPKHKCQTVVIRIIKKLWKDGFYWFMMRNGIFFVAFLLLLWKLECQERISTWVHESPLLLLQLFHLMQLKESPPTQLGKFIAWNSLNSWLSVNGLGRLELLFNLHANQFPWPQHRI